MNKRIHLAPIIAAVIAAILSFSVAMPLLAQLDSPSTTPARGDKPIDIQGDGRQQAADASTTLLVRAALQLDSELKTQTILVETINGKVRLTGQVTSSSNFDRAKDVVAKVDGVKGVENMLVVREVRPL
ncbi:MAG: BON domain-containing protein [Betaproteobacteria bacterium]